MTKSFYWVVGIIGAAILYLYWKSTQKPNSAAPAAQTTNTAASALPPWFPQWAQFNNASTSNATATVKTALASLISLSNAFGRNDGGRSGGVSISGSGSGGTASSGGGAGNPVIASNDSVWDDWNPVWAYNDGFDDTAGSDL